MIDARFARKHSLQRIPVTPRTLVAFDGPGGGVTDEVAVLRMDIDGHTEEKVFAYVVPRIAGYDMILGLPWFKKQDARLDPRRMEMRVRSTGTLIRNRSTTEDIQIDCASVSAVAFSILARKGCKDPKTQVFSASLRDIERALQRRPSTDPRAKLPDWARNFLPLFDPEKSENLPPLRGKGIDHRIELESTDGKEATAPWGPLYSMSRDELLVLRKTLTDLLDKGFIRVSNSPAAAPVLFVKKPGGGLRFCVDYRGLNRVTRNDRYPLPLIYETLRNISKARWFTKLDVKAAFYKIRIAEGDEWLTAFRTRYGLYEWLVTPFGLANAPSTFQKYINWSLRDFLDEFCSAYIDDVLIYSSGTREDHRDKVCKVLGRLQAAGLQLDIDKCEFEVKSTKYLGFIIEAGNGLRMDPEKIQAITDWQAPTSVKGVRSFLGFANFYRRFIKDFSAVVAPLTDLTKKESLFSWSPQADQAFLQMKKLFTTAPILQQFDADKETAMETDASAWCTGGKLFQYDNNGLLRPCAYFSRKHSPAECNYEIYDKEMLAIINCLNEWDAELRSVKNFRIRTDHKNLEYFMTVRKLTERQMRWSLVLSRYNFTITYLKGKDNERADALSRREQDMPTDATDDRLQLRMAQLLKTEWLPTDSKPGLLVSPIQARKSYDRKADQHLQDLPDDLQALWKTAEATDQLYQKVRSAVRDGLRKLPPPVEVKVSLTECSISLSGALQFRDRYWVPEAEELRTALVQRTHDSMLCGHPGREGTMAILMRQFFWPNMAMHVRRVVRNCDSCGANKAWRDRRQGFLKPLPVPDRIWKELSMDFVVKLPVSGGMTNILVITDRLGKGAVFEPCEDMSTEAVADIFICTVFCNHGLPSAIVSDRGTQFVSALWARICKQLQIVRRLSTAYSPETDGATENKNQTLETYLRTFCNHAQDDWSKLLPLAELAINNREAASTGVSPFFLQHGYHVAPFEVAEPLQTGTDRSPIQSADNIIRKLRDATEWAQLSMATAQQRQESSANRTRQQSPQYKVGDKVWLSLENIRTDRLSKKLDAKHAKYTVTEVISPHNYRLDTPKGIHNVFHTKRLRLAATDPLPSQQTADYQPAPQIIADTDEYGVEQIVKERFRKKGRGVIHEFLVKWVGYQKPTWEPSSALEETAALDEFRTANGQ